MNELESLSDRFWDLCLEASPSMATLLGDRRFDHALEEMSEESLERYSTNLAAVIAQAADLDRSRLDHQETITREMLISEASNALTMIETRVLVARLRPVDRARERSPGLRRPNPGERCRTG